MGDRSGPGHGAQTGPEGRRVYKTEHLRTSRLRFESKPKVWDPWAEPEPIFGPREIRHALSPHPGTPPFGNVAVTGPAGRKDLRQLGTPVRVEIGLERCGRWTCGLCVRASEEALEVAIGGRSVGTRDFLVAGRHVRLLVTPRGAGAFSLKAKVLSVESPQDPSGAVRAELSLDSQDPAARARWMALLADSERR